MLPRCSKACLMAAGPLQMPTTAGSIMQQTNLQQQLQLVSREPLQQAQKQLQQKVLLPAGPR
jgi:hypothetical protein